MQQLDSALEQYRSFSTVLFDTIKAIEPREAEISMQDHILWIFNHLTDKDGEMTKKLVSQDIVFPWFRVAFEAYIGPNPTIASAKVALPAVRCIGNIVASPDNSLSIKVCEAGFLHDFRVMLISKKNEVKLVKEIYWIVSNMCIALR